MGTRAGKRRHETGHTGDAIRRIEHDQQVTVT